MRDLWSWTGGPEGRGRAASYTGECRARLETRANKKWVRLVTVLVYVLTVSLAAAVLVLYYSLIWKPTAGPGLTRTGTGAKTETREPGASTSGMKTSEEDQSDPHGPGPTDPPQAGLSSSEPPAVTADDPSNLPTHRAGCREVDREGSSR
ncbi:putative transmembrane protein INAFM2 [Labrus bergylta]|uniref:putative transmembrane protein INAFM2 n=1 Tax=Labrus bergylta TaxID=56723 RepID=UPI0009B34F0A|nr:putative transmembrane protein INAFM2 [Labrus bergylta]